MIGILLLIMFKIKTQIIVLFIVLVLIFPFANADIISVNSGGDLGLAVSADKYLEGFFLWANRFPVASNLILNSSSGLNSTNDNLSIYYSSTDADRDAITNITDWRRNGNSIAVLNMPFNKRVNFVDAGAIRDYSSFGNNGTLGGGTLSYAPNWTSSGKYKGAYVFDGVNDYIRILDPADGSLDFGTENFSIEAWFYLNVLPNNWKGIFVKGASGTTGYSMTISSENRLSADIQGASGTNQHVNCANSVVIAGQWYHGVAVFDRNDKVYIYLNGQEKCSESYSSGNTNSVSNSINPIVGAYSGLTEWFFNGTIDEVRIYNRTLSSQQIYELYLAGLNNRSLEKLVSQETEKGETWQVALTPNDVYNDGTTIFSNNLTIENEAPNSPTNVKLVSLNGRNESDSDLNCSAYISDNDDTTLIVYVNWFKNGSSQFIQQFNSQNNNSLFWTLLKETNLTLWDGWKCSVRTYDNSKYSSWVNSSEIMIIDITNPNVTILSPNSTYEYPSLGIDFNISISENENISWCGFSLNQTANVTMWRFNDSYFWYEPSVIPGTHNVTFWCNDTSGNWGTNSTNFTILTEAAISIQLSPALGWNVNWSLVTLPANDLDADGNNGDSATDYYVNISATSVTVDLYVRANGDLLNSELDVLGLGNETYAVNTTNSSVPNPSKVTMTTNYVLIGDGLEDNSVVYLKFYLDAQSGQPAGTYTNNLDFKAVVHGQSV